MYDKKGSQIDIAVLDFSKAFDTVPHDGLLSKLKHYGIDKNIWQWISNFLKKRKQCVVVDGVSSRRTLLSVTSCECPECDCHFSTRTNFLDKYLMRSRTPNTWGLPSATT